METKESVVITFRVSPEESQSIDAKAAEAGQNRAEYARNLVLAGDNSQQLTELKQQFAEMEKHYRNLLDTLAAMTAQQENRKCTNRNHAETFGVGHCFICDLPIASKP
jgi:uncharacterized protein (DUF1778 family)